LLPNCPACHTAHGPSKGVGSCHFLVLMTTLSSTTHHVRLSRYGLEKGEHEGAKREEEIVQMDEEIGEKEGILKKLMDTVKGYSGLKADFERLLDEIGSLEVERQNLEMELDRAKKEQHANPKGDGTNSVVVDRIKERFQRVKKELEQMREERKKKESAYRLMQRESKQCEALTKEIKKLKESQVMRVKTQKNALVVWQKKEKEAQHKFSLLRKSDVKKQQQMNTLKSEIVKKDRVLGHKDREIGRINSKLRACEGHISQLLRIQNRNRTRTNEASKKACKKGDTDADMFGSGFALEKAEAELLRSGKSMLDNLVKDRVEKRVMLDALDRKAAALQALNGEMIQEAVEMESLLASRKILIAAAATSGDSGSDVVVKEEEELRRVEVEGLDTAVLVCEANIDRISHELDTYVRQDAWW
jgi:hypothetical protein